jgi:hypothetical protein
VNLILEIDEMFLQEHYVARTSSHERVQPDQLSAEKVVTAGQGDKGKKCSGGNDSHDDRAAAIHNQSVLPEARSRSGT